MIMSGPAARSPCSLLPHTPSIYQLLTYAFFILQNIAYEKQIGLLPDSSILAIIIQSWRYILIVFIVYEGKMVTSSDTRDPLLQAPESQEEYDQKDLTFCVFCNSIVLKSSYHCWRCKQCSHHLDHHCKFLNCCIAAANYEHFLRLVSLFILYSLDYITLLWISSKFSTLMWCILAVSSVELLLALALFGFHIYLGWCYNGSTLSFYQFSTQSNPQPAELKQQTEVFR